MQYCRFCGSQAPDDALFCRNCGQALAIPPPATQKKQDEQQQSMPPVFPFSERPATGNVPLVQGVPQQSSIPFAQGTPSSLSPISVAGATTKVTLSVAAKWIIVVVSCAAIVAGSVKVLPIVFHTGSTSQTGTHPVPTTVPMPPTLTTCPPSGAARAALIEPMVLGKDQNIVYIDNEGASDHSASGALKRYDVNMGKTTEIFSAPSLSIYEAQVSTDGQWILLVTEMNGIASVQMIRMDGQGLQTLYCTQAQNVSDVQWSPDQASIAFADIGRASIPKTTIFLLNTRNGQLRTLVTFQGPFSGCCVQLSWLDSIHLTIIGVHGLTDTPDEGDPLLLDTSLKGVQQEGNIQSMFHPASPANGPDSLGQPCYDFASSYDRTQVFVSQCSLTRYFPMAGDAVVQQGPSSISVESVTGGPLRTIYADNGFAIAGIQTISRSRLLFYVYNYSSQAGQNVNPSQNGLWTINTNGSGLTHLASATVGETGHFFFQIPTSTWLVISRDGSMYASSTSDYYAGSQSLFFGSLNAGGAPTTFLSRQFGPFLQEGNINVIGWTTM